MQRGLQETVTADEAAVILVTAAPIRRTKDALTRAAWMQPNPATTGSTMRRAAVAPFVIFAAVAFLGLLGVAVNHAWLASVRVELQSSVDSGALAAAAVLVNDDRLRSDPTALPALLESSLSEAAKFAGVNPVRERRLEFEPNVDNSADGDIVLAILPTPRASTASRPGNIVVPAGDLFEVNTIRITGRLRENRGTGVGIIFGPFLGGGWANMSARCSATLDGGIRGIRPSAARNVLLAPIAILSDPSSADPKTWEHQVEARNGPDAQRFDPSANNFVADPAGDKIHEFSAVYALDAPQLPTSNVVVLQLGTTSAAEVASQIQNGVSADQLAAMSGSLILPETGGLSVAGEAVGPAFGSPDLQALVNALDHLRTTAAVRIWPLYSAFDSGTNTAAVSGFVAARVVSVAPPASGQPLMVQLQPTAVAPFGVVTDTDLRGKAATMNANRYVVKIRRVE